MILKKKKFVSLSPSVQFLKDHVLSLHVWVYLYGYFHSISSMILFKNNKQTQTKSQYAWTLGSLWRKCSNKQYTYDISFLIINDNMPNNSNYLTPLPCDITLWNTPLPCNMRSIQVTGLIVWNVIEKFKGESIWIYDRDDYFYFSL